MDIREERESASRSREHICLSIFGRCGSLFLHSLFDGHPELSSIPGIAPYKILSALVRAKKKSAILDSSPELPDMLAKQFCSIFNHPVLREDAGFDRLGPQGKDVAEIDPAVFAGHLRAIGYQNIDVSIQGISEALHDAFDATILKPRGRKVFLHLHTMFPDDSEAILSALRHRHVIFLVRNPVDNVESCAAHLLNDPVRRRSRLTKFYDIINGMLSFQSGQPFLDARAVAVRLEDLKRHQEVFLRRLCEAVELDFDASLLQSTAMGLQYHSAPTKRNPGMSGFAAHNAQPQGYRLSPRDRLIFSTLFADISGFMDYPRETGTTLQEVVAYLDRNVLDVEAAFAQMIGIAPPDFGLQRDVRQFRERLAGAAQAKPEGLNCRRLLFTA